MSEPKIHHWSQWSSWPNLGGHIPEGDLITGKWSEVTCGSCRLEQPLAAPESAPEYRVPQHVLDTDRRLGLADELAAAERTFSKEIRAAVDAAQRAEQAGQEAARIRALLAEQEPAWRAPTPLFPKAAQAISEGSAQLAPDSLAQMFKPGPY